MIYCGLGYLVSKSEKEEMIAAVRSADRVTEIESHFHLYNKHTRDYFFGEIIYELPAGASVAVETIIVLPGLVDNDAFGFEYGSMLYDMGIDIETINVSWNQPKLYIINEENV